jgi:hypothetical protein
MPVLGDPDFPGDQRPEDPDDDAQWQAFFEDVVREYLLSRFPLAEDASAQERAAIEVEITAELQTIVDYYEEVRENERLRLAIESVVEQLQPATDSEAPADQQPDAPVPAAPLQQGAVQGETMTLGYVGQRWSDGGIGFEVRG